MNGIPHASRWAVERCQTALLRRAKRAAQGGLINLWARSCLLAILLSPLSAFAADGWTWNPDSGGSGYLFAAVDGNPTVPWAYWDAGLQEYWVGSFSAFNGWTGELIISATEFWTYADSVRPASAPPDLPDCGGCMEGFVAPGGGSQLSQVGVIVTDTQELWTLVQVVILTILAFFVLLSITRRIRRSRYV